MDKYLGILETYLQVRQPVLTFGKNGRFLRVDSISTLSSGYMILVRAEKLLCYLNTRVGD
jgi:hypothetical protein